MPCITNTLLTVTKLKLLIYKLTLSTPMRDNFLHFNEVTIKEDLIRVTPYFPIKYTHTHSTIVMSLMIIVNYNSTRFVRLLIDTTRKCPG